MKLRTDFVSNSSSSSFILKDAGFFAYFGITKQDIYDAIVDLYGGQELIDRLLKESIESHEKALEKVKSAQANVDDWLIEFHAKRIEELKQNGLGLFCVYDMKDENDRIRCYEKWDDHFESWYAPNEGEYSEWEHLINILTYKCGFCNINETLNGKEKELETSTYDRTIDKHVRSPFYGGASFMRHVKDKLNIKTMKEVLHDKDCTLMIHFDDNEVHHLKGMCDVGQDEIFSWSSPEDIKKCNESKWESKSYSSDRFFEILIDYFIEKGKINLADEKFMEYWLVPKDHWWKQDEKHKDRKYFTKTDDAATWKDVVDDMLYCNAVIHEG